MEAVPMNIRGPCNYDGPCLYRYDAMFKTQLIVELVDEADHGKWRLSAPLLFKSSLLRATVTVPAGFVSDFASVPRLPLPWLLAGDTAHRPAVVHDYLCGTQYPRKLVDQVFLEAMKVDGVPRWRRLLMYGAVRLYAIITGKQ